MFRPTGPLGLRNTMPISKTDPEDDVRFVSSGEALILAAVTALVLIALAAFWAIGTQAYTTWKTEETLVGTPPDRTIVASGSPVS